MLWPSVIFNTAPMQSSCIQFNTPHLRNGVILLPFQTSGQTLDLIVWSKLTWNRPSFFSFASQWICHLFGVIKYNCRVNMKLANQSVNKIFINFDPPSQSSCSGDHHWSCKSAQFPSNSMERSSICPHYAIYPQVESRKSFCFVLSAEIFYVSKSTEASIFIQIPGMRDILSL